MLITNILSFVPFVLIKENENLTNIECMDSNERDAVSYYNIQQPM